MSSQAGRIRVLHIIQNLNYGGMERLLADIVRGVRPARYESHVLVLQYFGRFAEGLERHATLHRADPMTRLSLLWPKSLIHKIGEIAPDVVHTHSGVWYKGALAARAAGVRRVIHTEHGRHVPDPWQARLLDGLASRRTDVAVAVSAAVAGALEQRVVRGHCAVEVVLNGVDTDLFRPGEDTGRLRAELGIAPDVPVIGSIGRVEPVKGFDVMLDAFAHLIHGLRPRAAPVLVIAGNGSQFPVLERRVRELKLDGRVHLLGWRGDVHDLLSGFDLFTMSSRSEGTSVSLLEAMSSGLCPIVTDVGGNAAVLGPSLAHRLVASEDPEALAAAWSDALTDRERRSIDAVAARDRVREAYSAESMIAAYERLYAG